MSTEPQQSGPSETATQMLGRPDGKWFYLGCAMLLVAAVAFFVAFFTGIDQSRKFLLLWLLPLVSGFCAGCFAGAMQLSGKKILGVTAAGGFAVYIFTFFHLRKVEIASVPWMPEEVYDLYVKHQKNLGKYPARQAGRLNQGVEEYSAEFARQPYCWRTLHGLYKAEFDPVARSYLTQGFTLQSVQSFTGIGGVKRYQGIFIKGTGECPPGL